MELTQIQQQILEFIKQSIRERQMPPTMHEIAEHMGYRSDNAAYQHLTALKRKKFIRLDGVSRGIRLLKPSGIPIVGQVAAGAPILAEQNIEDYLPFDVGVFKPAADFLLRVKGMSMCDAGIMDGDLLAVHKTPVATRNQIVVARIGDEVTVKRFRQRGSIITLSPENPEFKPIRIDLRKQDVAIEGIMTGLIRFVDD